VEALRAGLRDLGYVEGKNIVIEFRWAEGNYDRLVDLAGELVRLKVDVLGTHGTPGVLAAKQATWISRDDNSGTDQFEKQLWKDASLNPKGSSWYITSGQGMGATLTLADQKTAYTLSDRATYLARKSTLQSAILVEGGLALLNIYHVMPVSQAKFPNAKINTAGGKAFADFMVAPATQELIAGFGKDKYGQALFFPDAGKDEGRLGS